MKLINNIKGLFLAVSVAVTALGLTSCKDEPDKYETAGGKPTIDYVRCLSSEIKTNQDTESTVYTNGQLVESASPQSTLCLVGSNLRSIVEMYFNDQKAILNSSYITDNTLIVDVPKNIPSEVTNKIYMVTADKDTVSYDFQVIIPGPSISTMGCEYAKAGDTQTLVGQYFIDDPGTPLKVFFKDANGADLQADITDISSDYTTITFKVPEGAVEGAVKVTNVYGEATSAFHYLDTRGILFDFDGGGQPMEISGGKVGHGWHSVICQSDDTSITGNYIQLGDGATTMDDSTWDDGNFSFEYWPGNWEDPESFSATYGHKLNDVVDFTDWENMSLKFELCASNWSAAALQIIFAGVTDVSYGNAGVKDADGNVLGGCNNSYISGEAVPRALYRPWTTSGTFDTKGEWITVTVPLKSSLVYSYSGAAPTANVSKDSFASLVMFLCGGGVTGEACTPVLKIDNIRVVPNK